MYQKSWLENANQDKKMYFAIIYGKISVCLFTQLEADQYRNKYGDLYNTRKDAMVALAGGYKFGMSPL